MTITVIAHPGSKKPRIESDSDGTYHVYVHAKAHDGEANDAILRTLSEELHHPISTLSIVRGHTTRHKVIAIPEK